MKEWPKFEKISWLQKISVFLPSHHAIYDQVFLEISLDRFFLKTIQPGSRIWQLGDLREHFFSILAWSITIINFSGHLWWASDRLLLWAVDFNLAAAFNWQILLLTPPTDNKNQTNGQTLGNNQEPDSGIETESCVKKVPKFDTLCELHMWLLGVQLLLRTYRQQLGEVWELLGEITIFLPNVDFS